QRAGLAIGQPIAKAFARSGHDRQSRLALEVLVVFLPCLFLGLLPRFFLGLFACFLLGALARLLLGFPAGGFLLGLALRIGGALRGAKVEPRNAHAALIGEHARAEQQQQNRRRGDALPRQRRALAALHDPDRRDEAGHVAAEMLVHH